MRDTIQKIAEKMNRANLPWLLAGKTAAVLQGVLVHSNNLVMYTTETGSNFFGEAFDEFRTQKIKLREDKLISGMIGQYRIREIDVTIVGNPEIMIEHRKWPLPVEEILIGITPIEIGIQQVPLLPLEWIAILALLEQDQAFVRATMDGGLDKKAFVQLIEQTGMNYYLKPKMEGWFFDNQPC